MTRSHVLTASLAALAAALSFAASQFTSPPDDRRTDADSASLSHPADPRFAEVVARSAAKDEVTREYLAGRMTLPEATARFARLNALPPCAVVPPPDILVMTAGLPEPGDCTEAELAAVQVVVRAVSLATRSESPERARETRERVWRQFLADRSAGRLARLPDVPGDEVDERLSPAGDRPVDVATAE